MIEHPTDLESSLQALTTAALDPTEGHLTPEEVMLYHGGTLEPETHARLEEHLLECRECFDLMRDLAAFEERTSQPQASLTDFEAAAFWRTLRPHLPDLPRKEPPEQHPPSPTPRFAIPTAWRSLKRLLPGTSVPGSPALPTRSLALARNSLAAGLAASLMAVLALSFWVVQLQRQGPNGTDAVGILTSVVHNVGYVGIARGDEVEVITESTTLLHFPKPYGAPDGTRYTLKVFDAQEKELQTIPDLAPQGQPGSFSFSLPPGALPVGDYRFVFFSQQGQALEKVGDIRIRVVP